MYITYITLVLHLLHALQSILICITHYKCNVWAGNLLNLHEDYRGRSSTWYVCCFLPSLGAESRWDDRGGNSISVRNTELMMECNDCLFEGWNEQTATTHPLSLGGYTSPVDESDSVPASRSPSPAVVCSQYRLRRLLPVQWEEGILSSRTRRLPLPHRRTITSMNRRTKVRARCGRRRPGSSATENSRFTRRTTALYHSPTLILGCTKAGATTITRHTQSKIYAGRAALITS